jgi:hypothetical protein
LIPIKKAFQVDPYQTMRGWLSGMLIEAPALISRLFCRAMDPSQAFRPRHPSRSHHRFDPLRSTIPDAAIVKEEDLIVWFPSKPVNQVQLKKFST